jgi:hypothetical protein
MTQNLDDFIYVVILPNFWQALAQTTDHLQKWQTHLWRALFIFYTPDILSFRLNVLKIKFFEIEFDVFIIPCVVGHPVRDCWTEMLARSLDHIIILVHFRSKL